MPNYYFTDTSDADWENPFSGSSSSLARLRSANNAALNPPVAQRPSGSSSTGTYTDPFSMAGGAGQIAENTAMSNLGAASSNTRLAQLTNEVNQAAQRAANAGRLGPQGQQIQANALTNIERASAGLLDPQTETMLRSGINENFRGGAVDSPALAAAYRRGMGQTIEQTEADAERRYIAMLAANPSAPIYNMGELYMNPATYAGAASAEAGRQLTAQEGAAGRNAAANEAELARQQQSELFYSGQEEAARRAEEDLAYRYYVANLGQSNRSAGGGGGGGYYNPGGRTLSAADYNSAPSPYSLQSPDYGGGGIRTDRDLFGNPIYGTTNKQGTTETPALDYWDSSTGGYSETRAPRFVYNDAVGGFINTATGGVSSSPDSTVWGDVSGWAPSDFEETPVATEPGWWEDWMELPEE